MTTAPFDTAAAIRPGEGNDAPATSMNLTARLTAAAGGAERDVVLVSALGSDGEIVDQMSPAQWHHRARALAVVLSRVVAPGDRIVVPAMDGLDFHVGLLACLYAGAIAVPVPALRKTARTGRGGDRRDERLGAIVQDCQPAAIIVSQENSGEYRLDDTKVLPAVGISPPPAPAKWVPDPRALDPDAVALLQYTSGSTGEPRGVVLTHRHLVQNRLDAIERSGVGPDSTIVLWLPLFHDMGLCVSVLFPIVSGAASVHMQPMTFVRNPLVWLREISVHSDVYSSSPDFAFHMCVDRTTPEPGCTAEYLIKAS